MTGPQRLLLGLVSLACASTPGPQTATPPAAPVEALSSAEGQPQPVPARINLRYRDRTDPDTWAKQFEHEGREVFDRRHDIVKFLDLHDGMVVADVGAGTGMFTVAIAQALGQGGRVIAVDAQDYFVSHIAARSQALGLSNIETVLADQHHPNLPPNSVDLVFMCDTYHHLEYPQAYLEQLRAALRPQGRLVLIDYDRTNPHIQNQLGDHLRATPEVILAEIESSGFRLTTRSDLLKDNFTMVFTTAPTGAGAAAR